MMMKSLILLETIERRILWIRNEKVMIDRDLAELYGVQTKVLNQAVRRNKERFPENFRFQLTKHERNEVVTHCDHLADLRFSYQMPYVFTEHGVAMLSGVLKSKRAIQVNIQIMNTFVALRRLLVDNKVLTQKLSVLEKKYDAQFKVVFDSLRTLIEPRKSPYIIIKRKE